MKKNQIKKYLILGLIGALITVIGDMVEGFATYTDNPNEIIKLFPTIELFDGWGIKVTSLIAAIGRLIQFYGFYGLYLTFNNKESQSAKIYKASIYAYTITGAIVRIFISSVAYKMSIVTEFVVDTTVEVIVFFIAPIGGIFAMSYFIMSIFILTSESTFPKWVGLLNPFFGANLIKIFIAVLPGSTLTNSIEISNIGISTLILFFILLTNIECIEDKEEIINL